MSSFIQVVISHNELNARNSGKMKHLNSDNLNVCTEFWDNNIFEYDVTILVIAGKRIAIICMISYSAYSHYMVLLPKSPPFILILKVSQQIKIC